MTPKPFMSSERQTDNKRILKNTLVLYFRMLVLMATSLYTSRVVLAALGISDYGIYNVVGGVVAVLGFLNGTLSTASSRYITVSLGKDTPLRTNQIFSSVMIINLLLCAFIVLLGETVGLWFLRNKMIISEARVDAAFWVYQISIITVLLNIISVPYNSIIIAHERMKAFAFISIFDAFAKLGVAYLISTIAIGDKLINYAILLLVIQLIDRFIYGQYCIRHFNESRFHFYFDKKLFKEMGAFMSWSSYGSLVSVGFTHGLNIVLNMFCGTAVNAARGISVQVQNAVNSFVINFQTAINPQITKSVARKDYECASKLFILSSKYSFFLICFLGLPIIGNADFILSIWLKQVPEYTKVFLQIMLVTCMFQSLAHPIRVVNQAEGNIKKFQIYECSFLALILPVSYIAMKYNYPPTSVFIVQLTIEILAHFIRMYIVLPKIGMTMVCYVKQIYMRILPTFIPVLVLSVYLEKNEPTWLHFFTNFCLIEVAALTLSFTTGLDSQEKKWFVRNIANKIHVRKINE